MTAQSIAEGLEMIREYLDEPRQVFLQKIGLNEATFRSWLTAEVQNPRVLKKKSIVERLEKSYPDKIGEGELSFGVIENDHVHLESYLRRKLGIYSNVFDDICGDPVVISARQDFLVTKGGGFYALVRRHRSKNEFIREILYIGERDKVGVVCYLYSNRGSIYRGGAYRDVNSVQMIFARPDQGRSFSSRFAVFRMPEHLRGVMNGVMLRPTGNDSEASFAHVLLHRINLAGYIERSDAVGDPEELANQLRAPLTRWREKAFKDSDLFKALNSLTADKRLIIGELTPAHKEFSVYRRMMNGYVVDDDQDKTIYKEIPSFHDSRMALPVGMMESITNYLDRVSDDGVILDPDETG